MRIHGWLVAVLGATLTACPGGNGMLPPDTTDSGSDSTPADSTSADTIPADTIPADTIPADTTVTPDTVTPDAAVTPDTAVSDTVSQDTPADSIPTDTAPMDTGPSCLPSEFLCGGGCVTPMSSLAHCGRCDNRCPTGTNGTPTCVAGRCGLTCAAGFGDCDMSAANGCEATLATDAMHCGMCGMRCTFANAAARCAMGACALGACSVGFGDCDGAAANGCETDLSSAAPHCGRCGMACPMGQLCNMGRCELRCTAPLMVCGTGAMARCANTQTDPTACGGCSAACAAPANARATCAAGACGFECNAGFADCDGMAANGCEVGLATSAAHCGRCRNACSFPNSVATCTMGACTLGACSDGFGNCDSMAANGCETNTRTSSAHCGRCGNACAADQHCASGACVAGPPCIGSSLSLSAMVTVPATCTGSGSALTTAANTACARVAPGGRWCTECNVSCFTRGYFNIGYGCAGETHFSVGVHDCPSGILRIFRGAVSGGNTIVVACCSGGDGS